MFKRFAVSRKFMNICFTFAAPNPCDLWPENYFEKYNEPNVALTEEMYKYGRKNLALIQVMIQSPYFTKIKRDVEMTFTTYIANSGGLLGLCLGFSFMSGIEIIFVLCWLFSRFRKNITIKQNRIKRAAQRTQKKFRPKSI